MAKLLPVGFVAGIVTIIICLMFQDAILAGLYWVGLVILVFLVGAGLVTLWVGVERALTAREQRLMVQIQRKASGIIQIQDGVGQLFVHEIGTHIFRNLTTNPSNYINGHKEEPTQAEMMMQALFFQAIGKGHTAQPGNAVAMLPASVEAAPELLPILDKAQRVLIKAASNTGKTTLLKHIADRRPGAVLVLDSQSYPGKWPERCRVVGTGSDHAAISVALDGLIELMVKRYKEIGQGLVREGEHPRLTIIIDEWMAIVSECSNASDVIRRLLTESRKAAFSVFIGSHSERVKALGLDGQGDLRDGFLIVRIELENGQRIATYDYGRGERPCALPGEYTPSKPVDLIEIEAITTPASEQKPESQPIDTDRVLELFDTEEATTPSAICNKLFGYKNKMKVDAIRAILIEHGRLG